MSELLPGAVAHIEPIRVGRSCKQTRKSVFRSLNLTFYAMLIGVAIGAIAGGATGFGIMPFLFPLSAPVGAMVGGAGGAIVGIPTALFTYHQRLAHPELRQRQLGLRVMACNAAVVAVVAAVVHVVGVVGGNHNPESARNSDLIILLFSVSIVMTSFFAAQIFDNHYRVQFKGEYPSDGSWPSNDKLFIAIVTSSILLGLISLLIAVNVGVA